jgi:hypothetical protein
MNVFTGADANIVDFWNNIVSPAFEKANPGLSVKVVDAGDDSGLRAIAERRGGPLERADRKVLLAMLNGDNDTEIMDRLRLSRPDLDHHLANVVEHLLGVPATPRHRRPR